MVIVRSVVTTTKFIITKQNVSVIAMNDDERHLLEYENYEKRLEESIPKETDKRERDWLENRLKSVKRRIIDTKKEIENGTS